MAIGKRSGGVIESLAVEIGSLVAVSEWFQDASTAHASLINDPPALVLLDLSDGVDGKLGLAARVAEELPETFVVALAQDPSPGLVVDAFRAKVSDLIAWPPAPGEALSVIRRLFESKSRQRKKGEVYSVFSMKGGQGVTTIALNLADHIHRLSGRNVLLLDMNLYSGDLRGRLKTVPSYTPFDLQRDIKRLDRDLLFSSLPRHERGFHILACPDEISDAEQIGGQESGEMVESLASHMDYLIMDLSHDFSSRNFTALQASDTILLILQQDIESVKSALRVLRFFRELGQGEEKIRLVLNRHTNKEDLNGDDLAKIFDQRLFYILENDYRAVLASINLGATLDSVDKKRPLNKGIGSLAEKLTGISAPSLDRHPWRRALKGGFFASREKAGGAG